MKTCWQVLGIEATTDTDAIRQAYLALLPSFHPETDPQGFKQLREAYENALQGTTSPAITVVDEDPDTPWVNYLREIFGDFAGGWRTALSAAGMAGVYPTDQ